MTGFLLVLSKLRLTNSVERLALSVESSVSLNCPDGNAEPLELSELTGLLSSGKAWVSRGNGCHIDFKFLFDGQKLSDQSTMRAIIQDLSSTLRDAPLWSQFLFDPMLELDPGASLDSGFSIQLKHRILAGTPSHPRNLLLSGPENVRAPAGIKNFEMQKVAITLKFSLMKTSSEPTLERAEPVKGLSQGEDTPCCLEEEVLLLDKSSETFALPPWDQFDFSGGLLPNAGVCFESMFCDDDEMLEENLLYRSNNITPSLTKSSSQSSAAPQSSWGIDSQETGDVSVDEGDTKAPIELKCLRKMSDLALRNLIGGSQTKGQPGMLVKRSGSTQTLSRLAPGMWSPGFLQSMSQRSQFLPTISHALSTSLLRNVQSPSLRRKLVALASEHNPMPHDDLILEQDEDTGDGQLKTSKHLDRIVQERLWSMTYNSLYDPLSARRLNSYRNDVADQEGGMMTGLVNSLAGPDLEQPERTSSSFWGSERVDPLDDDFDNLFGDEDVEDFQSSFVDTSREPIYDDFEDLFESEETGRNDQMLDAELGEDKEFREDEEFGENEKDFDLFAQHDAAYWRGLPGMYNWDEIHIGENQAYEIENQNMLI